jgi:hypothetical protein
MGFDETIVFPMHNISGVGCNYTISSLFLEVWCVIECGHHSTHQHPNYNPYQLWGWVINGTWILLAH